MEKNGKELSLALGNEDGIHHNEFLLEVSQKSFFGNVRTLSNHIVYFKAKIEEL